MQPVTIYENKDNQSCIALSVNPMQHQRTKHIDIIRHHFMRERVEAGEVELVYISTNDQLADLLTKGLQKPRMAALRARVLGYE